MMKAQRLVGDCVVPAGCAAAGMANNRVSTTLTAEAVARRQRRGDGRTDWMCRGIIIVRTHMRLKRICTTNPLRLVLLQQN
jgi:hypothetical protein